MQFQLKEHLKNKENVHYQFEPITFEPGFVNGAKYKVSISQSVAEVSEFQF